jgi:5-methyltetrahydropteroyltriglutamate--homocysteine methyltransferase
MKRSSAKILTTHVGALPELSPLDRDAPEFEARLKSAVGAIVEKQRAIGLDVINEGEYTKGGDWLAYVEHRFGGFEQRPSSATPLIVQGKDRETFPEFYRYATERGILFYLPARPGGTTPRPTWVCTGPVTYRAEAEVQREIDLLKAFVPAEDAFLTTTAPASLEVYRRNEYYKTDEEYVFAIAEAMRVEYELIAKSGVLLQVDDAWLPALWDRIGIQMGLEAFRRRCEIRVEALNHALANIPEDRIRYHLCWGSWHGPHAFDLEMKYLVDIMLKVKAEAYLIEAANARHEHEYDVWESVKLPDGKILVPGCVTHSTDLVEHPELVSQRIQRFAKLVGKENVMAGTDCGFGWRSHPEIAWAKLRVLVEGAERATKALKYA